MASRELLIDTCSSLKQYHFERADFVKEFKSVFTTDEICSIEFLCQDDIELDTFLLFYSDDEFYIYHKPTDTIINWYKHLGRINTCNKPDFALEDLHLFLQNLKNELDDHRVIR